MSQDKHFLEYLSTQNFKTEKPGKEMC